MKVTLLLIPGLAIGSGLMTARALTQEVAKVLSLPAATWRDAKAAANARGERVELSRSGFRINVTIGGKPFTRYYFDPKQAKPYFQPLRSAQGTEVTRSYPVGDEVPKQFWKDPALEPHQRPMYFAHGDINGLDFWSEEVFMKFYGKAELPFGRTVFRKLDEARGGASSGHLKAEFDLIGPHDKVIGSEIQDFIFRGDEDTRTADCTFIIRANRGAIHMNDSKEGTFGIRVAPELDSPPGHMIDSEGRRGEKGIWGKRADWVDYYGKVKGEDVGIAIFDSPKSFRHPTYWHARGYGLFAANPFGIREFTRDPQRVGSTTIPAGGALTFRYRVLIHHGDYQQAGIADAYRKFAAAE